MLPMGEGTSNSFLLKLSIQEKTKGNDLHLRLIFKFKGFRNFGFYKSVKLEKEIPVLENNGGYLVLNIFSKTNKNNKFNKRISYTTNDLSSIFLGDRALQSSNHL